MGTLSELVLEAESWHVEWTRWRCWWIAAPTPQPRRGLAALVGDAFTAPRPKCYWASTCTLLCKSRPTTGMQQGIQLD